MLILHSYAEPSLQQDPLSPVMRTGHVAPRLAPAMAKAWPVLRRCCDVGSIRSNERWAAHCQPACGRNSRAAVRPSRACLLATALPRPRVVDHVPCGRGPYLRADRSRRKRGVPVAAAAAAGAAGAAAAAQQAAQSSLPTLLISVGIFVMTCAVAVFLICAVPTLLVRAACPSTAPCVPVQDPARAP